MSDIANQAQSTSAPLSKKESYFDGNFWQWFGRMFLYFLLRTITLDIARPAAECMLLRWQCKHTVINGRRLKFTGTGAQLSGKYFLWWLLRIITCGIFSLWMSLNMQKWITKHTVYEDDNTGASSRFTGGIGGYWGWRLLAALLTVCTCGIGTAWAIRMVLAWDAKNTYISGTQLAFKGSSGQLFGKIILWTFLTVITGGIFGLFVYIKFLKWQYKHTEATAVDKVPGEVKATIGVVICVLVFVIVPVLIAGALIFLFLPIGLHRNTHIEVPSTVNNMYVLNDADHLALALADAQQLPGNFASCVDFDEIEGVEFSFSLDHSLIPADRQGEAWTHDYFIANGKIGTTAYWDDAQDTLYLDYGVENANCPTYLCLDSTQTGTGNAATLTQLISGGNGIHSVAYPYDTAPEYVYIMSFCRITDNYNTEDDIYYFVTLHKQDLNVVMGVPEEPELVEPEDILITVPEEETTPTSDITGTWVILSKPKDSTTPEGRIATFADGGWYTFHADGTFDLQTRTLACQDGAWFDMGGGEKFYKGTYEQNGNMLTLHYTTTYKQVWNDATQETESQPVALDETEQLDLSLQNEHTTDFSHSRFGQVWLFKQTEEMPMNVILGFLAYQY